LSQDAQALGGTGQMFNTRHLAMYMSGIWEVIWNSQAEGLRYDVAPLPKGPSGRYTFHKPNGAVIPVTTRDAQAAWKLVSFLQGPAVEKQMVQCKGWMPFLKESVETFLEKGCIPNAKLFVDTLVNGLAHALPVNKNGAKMDQIVADALGAALSSGKDAKWVIAQVEPQLQTLVG
ncbi:MAG: extracellular solute-binding protein, partial [Candidatus Oleimicrobiaceae bacterium]